MGDPRFEVGAPYNVGTCKAGGVCSRSALLCFQGPTVILIDRLVLFPSIWPDLRRVQQ
jgi:hypothetical protein